MDKISFFFGAGAECKNNFDMPSGDEYEKDTLTPDDFSKTYGTYINNRFNRTYCNDQYKYEKRTISSYAKKTSIECLKARLDFYFHSIISPKNHKIKFSCVFSYYWSCYFVIVNSILKYLNSVKRGADLRDYYYGEMNYDKVLSNMVDFTEKLYSVEISDMNDNYYSLIRTELNKRKDLECDGIITTNYFHFAEKIMGKDTAYLNGNLKMFEFPELLEVRSFLNSDKEIDYDRINDCLFFPFIFGQSNTKPIVSSKQIVEYNKFYNILKGCKILVVLGYSFGETDNHINSFIHDYLEDGNKLIVVSEEDDEEKLKEQLHTTKKIEICKVKYSDGNKRIVTKIFETIEKH
ncbi:MAG: hypothetical protein IJJ74_09535 [Eubacterium sp.]|nr:hypothetical protein [Eubacterium sp.]